MAMRRSDREEPTPLRDLLDLLTKAVTAPFFVLEGAAADGGRADVDDDETMMLMYWSWVERTNKWAKPKKQGPGIYVGPRSQNRDLVQATFSPFACRVRSSAWGTDTDIDNVNEEVSSLL